MAIAFGACAGLALGQTRGQRNGFFDPADCILPEAARDCLRTPFTGIGKPEPLRGNLKGWWSRRITQEHRLVYRCENDTIIIMQCRFHYEP